MFTTVPAHWKIYQTFDFFEGKALESNHPACLIRIRKKCQIGTCWAPYLLSDFQIYQSLWNKNKARILSQCIPMQVGTMPICIHYTQFCAMQYTLNALHSAYQIHTVFVTDTFILFTNIYWHTIACRALAFPIAHKLQIQQYIERKIGEKMQSLQRHLKNLIFHIS